MRSSRKHLRRISTPPSPPALLLCQLHSNYLGNVIVSPQATSEFESKMALTSPKYSHIAGYILEHINNPGHLNLLQKGAGSFKLQYTYCLLPER